MTTLRTLTLAALAAATLGGAAMAADGISQFSFVPSTDRDAMIELGTVRAGADGVVEIYDVRGNLLGTESVRAGANSDVRVHIGHRPTSDVVAVLNVGGVAVDTIKIHVQ